jgi:predicted HTH domain antitoxin
MGVIISDDILEATHMTDGELKQEFAILLYQKEKLTLAQASRLAGLDRLQFQHLLASRRIPINYDIEDLNKDLDTLRKIGRI